MNKRTFYKERRINKRCGNIFPTRKMFWKSIQYIEQRTSLKLLDEKTNEVHEIKNKTLVALFEPKIFWLFKNNLKSKSLGVIIKFAECNKRQKFHFPADKIFFWVFSAARPNFPAKKTKWENVQCYDHVTRYRKFYHQSKLKKANQNNWPIKPIKTGNTSGKFLKSSWKPRDLFSNSKSRLFWKRFFSVCPFKQRYSTLTSISFYRDNVSNIL